MKKSNAQATGDHLFVRTIWILFLVVLPFIFSINLIDEDNLPKLVVFALTMIFLSVRSFFNSSYQYTDKKVLYILLVLTSYFFYAFFRSDSFSAGIFSLITLLWPFYLFALIRTNKIFKADLIFKYLPFSAILLCIIALIQLVMLSGFSLQPAFWVRATLSNKNFLSEALILCFIICLAGSLNSSGMVKKINIAALFVILFTLIVLQTLAAFICLLLILVISPVFLLVFGEKESKNRIFRFLLLPGIITLVLVLFLGSKTTLFRGVINKMEYAKAVISGESLPPSANGLQNSVFERIYLWKNSLKLFSESPVNGIGLSDWQIYWPKYGMHGASFLDAAVMRYEHPHNEYILLLTETGVAGLLVYLLFFLYIVYTGIRFLFSGKNILQRQTVFIVLTGIISMAVLSFFGYPVHRPFTIFLCMLLCLFVLNYSDSVSETPKVKTKFLSVWILIFSIFALYVFVNRMKGEFYMSRALTMQSKKNFEGMLRMIRKSESKYYTLDNSSTPLDWYKGFAMFYQGNDSALYYYQKSEQQNPYHVQTLSDIGALMENRGKHQEAIQYFKRVLSFVPEYYQAHYNLAVAYFNLGRPMEALREINARTAIGYEYLKTLDIILARNAALISDSCAHSVNTQTLLKDKVFLRNLNKDAINRGVRFDDLLCDTLRKRFS